MKLRFLGTRGEVEARTRRHERHSALLVSYRGRELLLDCGLDWRGRLGGLRPAAIVLTHAHPDHAGGLRDGAPAPVHATEEAWAGLARYPIERRETLAARRRFTIAGIDLEAFPVEHSLRAPAVALRLVAGRAAILYAPDVAAIPELDAALRGISLYVGDGASIVRPIVRRRDGARIGHASIREQLDWCADERVARAVFTHCGSQILRDEAGAARRVDGLARERGVEVSIAHDGLDLIVRAAGGGRGSRR